MKKVHKVTMHSVTRIPAQCSAQAAYHQLWLFVLYFQTLWLYTGIHSMYTRMNNLLDPFITAQEIDFLITRLIILISIVFFVFSILLLEKWRMKNSGKITEYCYINPLYHIQISAQSIHYSSRNGFPDY